MGTWFLTRFLLDKYDCANTVRSYVRVWALILLADEADPDFEKLVFATYVLDLPYEFEKITRSIIRDRVGVGVKFAVAVHDPRFIPFAIFGM
jgi:hypothetical protein